MANKKIMDTTSNRGVFNKSRKIYLEQKGKIHCSRCPYHGCENADNKFYGTLMIRRHVNLDIKNVRYPNWKLVSKNKKQWMKKKIKIKRRNYKYFEDYFELFF